MGPVGTVSTPVSREEVLPGPGSGDRPTRTCRRWTVEPSRLPAGSRVQVCCAPSICSHLPGLSPPSCSTPFESFSPLVQHVFFSSPFRSTLSGSPGATSPRSSLVIALVCWKEFHTSLLGSLRSLSSLHSPGDRLAPRQPRSTNTVVPCLWNDLPTTAGGLWTRTTRGKPAPGSRPADTPSGRHHRVRGSVRVVVRCRRRIP